MASFDEAVTFVLANEGGFSERMADPGGATNFGISLRLLQNMDATLLRKCGIFEPLNVDTIRHLTVDQAKLVYRYVFWDAAPFFEIEDQAQCNYIFDCAVHHGVGQAAKLGRWGDGQRYASGYLAK